MTYGWQFNTISLKLYKILHFLLSASYKHLEIFKIKTMQFFELS